MSFIIAQNRSAVWITCKTIDNYHRINADSYGINYLEDINCLEESGINIKNLNSLTNYISHITGFETEKYIEYVEEGIPFIRITNIDNFFVKLNDVLYISKNTYDLLPKYHLELGDVLLSKDGTIGKAAIVNNEICNAISSSHVVTIRTTNEIDEYYLVAFLNSKFGENQCINLSTGSIQKALNVEKIRGIMVPVPSMEIQKYIGDKVRKAERLREESRNLKKEAEEVFNIELDINNLKKIVERESEKFIWIENEDIDERIDANNYNAKVKKINHMYFNYKRVKLKDIVEYKKGFAFKSEDYLCDRSSTLLLRVTDINEEHVDYDNMIKLPQDFHSKYSEFALENDDIVMVVTGNTTGKSVVISGNKFELLLNQNAVRLRMKGNSNCYFINLMLKSDYFQYMLKYSMFQSVQPFISMEFLNRIEIPIIEQSKVDEISKLYSKSILKLTESKELIKKAKQDIEDLIEGTFDMNKLNENHIERR